jgi:hypothetical protein
MVSLLQTLTILSSLIYMSQLGLSDGALSYLQKMERYNRFMTLGVERSWYVGFLTQRHTQVGLRMALYFLCVTVLRVVFRMVKFEGS